MPQQTPRDAWTEYQAEEAERGRRAARAFPYPLLEVAGAHALTACSMLGQQGKGAALVLGGPGDLYRIAARMSWRRERGESGDAVLAAAARVRFPEDLFVLREHKEAAAGPPTGPWPDVAYEEPPLAVASAWDFRSEEERKQGAASQPRRVPLERVYIALIAGADPSEAPAHLCWGGWNGVPSSEILVAVLRAWRERHGAELVGISHDTWSLYVQRPPRTREEALHLAREMLALCSEALGEVKTLQGQAALVMHNRWWNLWWD